MVRHDQGAAPKLAEARSVLRVTFEDGDVMGRAAREMLTKPVSALDFDALVTEHFLPLPAKPTPGQVKVSNQHWQDLRQLAWEAPTQEVGRGTAWGAFNALSEWSEWVRPKRPGSVNATESVLLGPAATVRQRAWDLLAPSWACSERGRGSAHRPRRRATAPTATKGPGGP